MVFETEQRVREGLNNLPIPTLVEILRLKDYSLFRLGYGNPEIDILTRFLKKGADLLETESFEKENSRRILRVQQGAIEIEGISHNGQLFYSIRGHLLPTVASTEELIFPDDPQIGLVVTEENKAQDAQEMIRHVIDFHETTEDYDPKLDLVYLGTSRSHAIFGVHSGFSKELDYEM